VEEETLLRRFLPRFPVNALMGRYVPIAAPGRELTTGRAPGIAFIAVDRTTVGSVSTLLLQLLLLLEEFWCNCFGPVVNDDGSYRIIRKLNQQMLSVTLTSLQLLHSPTGAIFAVEINEGAVFLRQRSHTLYFSVLRKHGFYSLRCNGRQDVSNPQ